MEETRDVEDAGYRDVPAALSSFPLKDSRESERESRGRKIEEIMLSQWVSRGIVRRL